MRVAMLSANLGSYDPVKPWPDQVVSNPDTEVSVHRFTDANFPPRDKAMTSRLQCGIPKWFGADLVGKGAHYYDVYIWIDASCTPMPVCAQWFLDKLGKASMAVFAHPERKTVREEYEFMTARLARPGETYLTGRYRGEWLDEEYAHCDPDARLVASTAFAYRMGYHSDEGRQMAVLREVWFHKTRYHLHDQLAFSSALAKHKPYWHVIDENYLKCPAFTFTRKR